MQGMPFGMVSSPQLAQGGLAQQLQAMARRRHVAPPTRHPCALPTAFMYPPSPALQQPQIILLKEGTDTSQGKPQLISNINACYAVADVVRTTLGPRGMDKLMHTERAVTVSNDGATIMKTLDIVHPAAKTLVDISLAQDAEVGAAPAGGRGGGVGWVGAAGAVHWLAGRHSPQRCAAHRILYLKRAAAAPALAAMCPCSRPPSLTRPPVKPLVNRAGGRRHDHRGAAGRRVSEGVQGFRGGGGAPKRGWGARAGLQACSVAGRQAGRWAALGCLRGVMWQSLSCSCVLVPAPTHCTVWHQLTLPARPVAGPALPCPALPCPALSCPACPCLQAIIRSFRQAAQMAVARVRELAVDIGGKDLAERKQLLEKCAQTSLNSKLVRGGAGECWQLAPPLPLPCAAPSMSPGPALINRACLSAPRNCAAGER